MAVNFKSALKKVASKVKTAANTKVGKAVVKAVKSTPQVKAATLATKTVAKAVTPKSAPKATPAPKIAPKVVSKPAPKTSSTKPAVSKSTSGFVSSLNNAKNNVAKSARDLTVGKAYASSEPLMTKAPSSTSTTQSFLQSDSNSILNGGVNFGDALRKMGVTRDFGVSELFGGNTGSVGKSLESRPFDVANPLIQAPFRLYGGIPVPSTSTASSVRPTSSQGSVLGYGTTGTAGIPGTFDISKLTPTYQTPAPRASSLSSYLVNPVTGSVKSTPRASETPSETNPTPAPTPTPIDPNLQLDQTQNPTNLLDQLAGDESYYGIFGDMPQQYDAGYATDISNMESYNQAELARAQAMYDRLLASYPTLAEDAKGKAAQDLQSLKAYLDNARSSGQAGKEAVTNTYGEALRRAAKNKKIEDARRRNLFSNLGTAESSAFIEAQTGADTAFGSDSLAAEREMAGKLSEIDNQVRQAEDYVGVESRNVVNARDAKIAEIQQSAELTNDEKSAYIQQVDAQAAQRLSELARGRTDFYSNLGINAANFKLALATALANSPYLNNNSIFGGTPSVTYSPDASYRTSAKAFPLRTRPDGTVEWSDGTVRDSSGLVLSY